MTEKMLEKGNKLLEEIKKLNDTVYTLESTINYIPKPSQPKKSWKLRFTNRKQDGIGEPEHAGIFLFNGISVHGIDVPIDEDVVMSIKEILKKKVESKQLEFEKLGSCDEE